VTVGLTAAPFTGPLAERLRGAPADGVRLYWLGQAGFVIEAAGRRLVIDPYLSDTLAAKYAATAYSHVRMAPPPVDPDGLGAVDFVLSTHHHTDHMDPGALAPLARRLPSLRFGVPAAALALARERTAVDTSRLIGFDAGDAFALEAGVSVRAVRAAHETLERDEQGQCRFLGYVIETPGARIYHSGDCAPFDGLVEEVAALRPDIALLPVNGRSAALRQAGFAGNFTLEEALRLCRDMGAPNLICHHYGMFAFNTVDPSTIDAAAAAAGFRVERAKFQVAYTVAAR
jgi:L-ascorbate metabolism protein UlaG (beta-lactamase superfamily)